MIQVTIYSRPDCHLCDIAKERVANVRRGVMFEVEEVDITTDSGLLARYGDRIPVVTVEGEEVCVYRVSEKLLKRRVAEAHARTGRRAMEEQGQAQEQGRTGVFGRIIGTFLSPGETFASVRASSSWVDWVVPWVIAAAVGLGVYQKIGPIAMQEGLDVQRERIAQNTNLSEDQRKSAMARIEKAETRETGGFWLLTVPVGSILILALFSGLYLGIANFLFGGTGTYLRVMAVAAYSGLIQTVEGLILTPLIVAKNTAKIAMGPALFFPPDMEHTWAYRLAFGVDIFTLWYLAVVSIGVGAVSGVAPRKVGAVLLTLWLVWVVGLAFFKNAVGM